MALPVYSAVNPLTESSLMKCGRCGHRMWLEIHHQTDWGKCVCGNLIPLDTEQEGIRIHHQEAGENVRLPRTGTLLAICLGALAGATMADTERLATLLEQDTSSTASQLGVLRKKGLVKAVTDRRGSRGGSMWVLTAEAIRALKL